MKSTEFPGDSTRPPAPEVEPRRSASGPLRVIQTELPPDFMDYDALKVVRRLSRFGYKAYLVGGGVRDLLLGATPKDFDVATNARPREVRKVFRNCRLIGRRFRLAHIHFQGKIIEVSTFRRNPDDDVLRSVDSAQDVDDLELADPSDLLIREDNVFGSEEQDARRRDFTCNALFYDLQRGAILDYVGGIPDVHQRLIKTIGPPAIRFAEDPVRILRAIKFAARLDMKIENRTWEAMQLLAPEIVKCPEPRVLEELLRMLRSRNPQVAYSLLHEVGALEALLPELLVSDQDLRDAVDADADADADAPAGGNALAPDLARERMAMLTAVQALQSRRAEPMPDPVLLAALFWPTIERRYQAARARNGGNGRARDFGAIISDTVSAAATRLRMPRRLLGRTNLILLAQGKLGVGQRRRLRPEALVRREFFGDALMLFEIRARALDRGWDLLALWRKLVHAPHDRELVQAILKAPLLDDPGRESPSATEDDAAPRRRGRRGGRRRRRRRGGDGADEPRTAGARDLVADQNGNGAASPGANGSSRSNGSNGTASAASSGGNGELQTNASGASHRPRRRRRVRNKPSNEVETSDAPGSDQGTTSS